MKQKTKDITPKEYARYRGWTLQNVTKHIRKGNGATLLHVLKVKNFSRFYLLEVPDSLDAKSFTTDKITFATKKQK